MSGSGQAENDGAVCNFYFQKDRDRDHADREIFHDHRSRRQVIEHSPSRITKNRSTCNTAAYCSSIGPDHLATNVVHTNSSNKRHSDH